LTERWDGKAWSVVSSPYVGLFSQLNRLSCVSAVSCQAAGIYTPANQDTGRTLIESWNGKVWSIAPSPSLSGGAFSQLNGVSCVSSISCTAVGIDGALIETYG
jgi:hypothetical protein